MNNIPRNILKEEQQISLLTLNKLLYNAYAYMTYFDITAPNMTYATDSVSGVVQYTDSLNALYLESTNDLAISPLTLNNDPKILNEYYNNNISDTPLINSTNTVSANYVVLSNNLIMIFGDININAPTNTLTINISQLFTTPAPRITELYYINIGLGEMSNTISPMSILNRISQEDDITVIVIGDLIHLNDDQLNKKLQLFAIGKIG